MQRISKQRASRIELCERLIRGKRFDDLLSTLVPKLVQFVLPQTATNKQHDSKQCTVKEPYLDAAFRPSLPEVGQCVHAGEKGGNTSLGTLESTSP